MNSPAPEIGGVLILADESADWMVAGLSQIDRLTLAMNESVSLMKATRSLPVCIYWVEEPRNGKRLPNDRRLTHLSLSDDLPEFSSRMSKSGSAVLVVDTHLGFSRGDFTPILQDPISQKEVPVLALPAADLSRAKEWHAGRKARVAAGQGEISQPGKVSGWYDLQNQESIPKIENRLLRETAKTQDGLVARFLNRPLSRGLSRLLVRSPLLPNQWTIMLTAFSVAGAILVMRGDYFGFALGAVLYQLHSMLDGCDGEIARVKYLESDLGRKLDGLCDRFTTLLYAVSLGIGLARQPSVAEALRWIYPVEGIVAALLIGVSETWLSRDSLDEVAAEKAREDDLSQDYLKAHRSIFNSGDQLKLWIIKNSGLLFLGDGLASLFGQLTKRDVFNFGFMLLALCGKPNWILHILAICACAIMVVAAKDLLSPALDARRTP